MEKLFVKYEEALALEELGFDKPCFAYFRDKKISGVNKWDRKDFEFHVISKKDVTAIINEIVLVPLYSQAFKFFMGKYKLYPHITQYYGESFFLKIDDMSHPRRWDEYPEELIRDFGEYSSQEEAELACLKKLIEIVKEK